MNISIGGFVCLLGLVACNVEHYEDCDGDGFEDGDAFGGSHTRAGTSSTSGKAGSTSASAGTVAGGTDAGTGGSGSAGTAAAAGRGGEAGVVPPDPCEKERECAPGYNCDLERHECVPAEEETCGELETEAACSHRSDCTPIYGGTNCSCGQDCECKGGEPGCVCESFQFFVCEATQ